MLGNSCLVSKLIICTIMSPCTSWFLSTSLHHQNIKPWSTLPSRHPLKRVSEEYSWGKEMEKEAELVEEKKEE